MPFVPSKTLKEVMKRAYGNPTFAQGVMDNRITTLRRYKDGLTEADCNYIKEHYRSIDVVSNDYFEWFGRPYGRPTMWATKLLYMLQGRIGLIITSVFLLALATIVLYALANVLWQDFLADVGLQHWNDMPQNNRRGGLSLAAFIALAAILLITRTLYKTEYRNRIAVVIGFTIVMVTFIAILYPGLNTVAQQLLVRALLLVAFTTLPVSFYVLFVTGRRHLKWLQFQRELRIIDPVHVHAGKPLPNEYKERFEAIYGRLGDDIQTSNALPGDDNKPAQPADGDKETRSAWPEDDNKLAQPRDDSNEPTRTPFVDDEKPIKARRSAGQVSFVVIFTTALIGVGWFLILFVFFSEGDFIPLEAAPFTFGFLGAYFFSLGLLFRRYMQSDLKSKAYSHVSKRILTTWVLAIALSLLPGVDLRATSLLVFVAGIFPDTAWQVIRQAMYSFFGLSVRSLHSHHPLNALQGMTIWVEARLLEEDIEDMQNLATADIVELLLRTNFPTDRLLNWIDQSILYLHLAKTTDANAGQQTQSGADNDKDLPDQSAVSGNGRRVIPTGPMNLRSILQARSIVTATDLVCNLESLQADRQIIDAGLATVLVTVTENLRTQSNMYHLLSWRKREAWLADQTDKLKCSTGQPNTPGDEE